MLLCVRARGGARPGEVDVECGASAGCGGDVKPAMAGGEALAPTAAHRSPACAPAAQASASSRRAHATSVLASVDMRGAARPRAARASARPRTRVSPRHIPAPIYIPSNTPKVRIQTTYEIPREIHH